MRSREPLYAVGLGLLTVVVYHAAPQLGLQLAWDDGVTLYGRPEVAAWPDASWSDRVLTPAMSYPTPLPTFVHWLVTRLPEARVPAAAHLLNLVVHLAAVVLAFRLVTRWTGRAGVAALAVAIWAAHPILVESVAWVANLKRLLAGAFVLGGALAWQRRLDDGRGARASAGCLVGALASHPIGLALVPVVVAQTAAAGMRRFRDRAVQYGLGPVVAGAAIYVVVSVAAYGESLTEATDTPLLEWVSAQQVVRTLSALTRHLLHLAWPGSLHPSYPWPYDGMARDAWIGGALLGALAAATVRALRKPATLPGLALWWGAYLPSMLLLVPRWAPDAFLYLPALGLFASGAALVPRRVPRAAPVVVAAMVALLGARSIIAQVPRWRDAVTLWAPAMDSGLPNAYGIVGTFYAQQDDLTRATATFDRGYEALRAGRRFTPFIARIYRQANQPVNAIAVALDILNYERAFPEDVSGFLIDTLFAHDLPVGDHPGILRTIREAAARTVAENRWSEDQQRELAEFFDRQGAPEIASEFR